MDEVSLSNLKAEIAELEQNLTRKKRQLEEAQNILKENPPDHSNAFSSEINKYSQKKIKITLFRSLFKGREDIYAKRFESKKTGKSGYQPVCRNEWARGVCEKPKASCEKCAQRSFEPVNDAVIRKHLESSSISAPFVMGIYPLLKDETCNFLAIDFDKPPSPCPQGAAGRAGYL
jgi:hypothetical protein